MPSLIPLSPFLLTKLETSLDDYDISIAFIELLLDMHFICFPFQKSYILFVFIKFYRFLSNALERLSNIIN